MFEVITTPPTATGTRVRRTSTLIASMVLAACASSGAGGRDGATSMTAPGMVYDVSGFDGDHRLDVHITFVAANRLTIEGTIAAPRGNAGIVSTNLGTMGTLASSVSSSLRRGGDNFRIEFVGTRLTVRRSADGITGLVEMRRLETQRVRTDRCEIWQKDPRTGQNLYCISWEMVDRIVDTGWTPPFPVEVKVSRAPAVGPGTRPDRATLR